MIVCTPSVMVLLLGGSSPHDPRRLSDRVIQRERADPTWAGPFDDAFPAGASQPRSRRRPVDQPEPVRSVSWLDSAGFPASGRGWRPRPARDGSAASHLEGLELFRQGPPPFSRTRMVRQNPREGNQRGHDDLRGSGRENYGTTGSGCQPRNRYPAPRTVST